MTEAKNSMTFYMTYGMKETCIEVRREYATGHPLLYLSVSYTECDDKD